MTRGEALKDFFRKTILPVASAALLYCIFRSACVKNGELDYLWLWILCGLPFGIWRLRLWIDVYKRQTHSFLLSGDFM